MTHPTHEAWLRWLHGSLDPDQSDSLAEHEMTCRTCARDVALFRRIREARGLPRWGVPGARARRSARRLPSSPLPPPAPVAKPLAWPPPDVRGRGSAGLAEARMVSRFLPGAELGILAVPPTAGGAWRVEGRLWLTPSREEMTRVVLLHDDHVYDVAWVADGGHFRFEEVMPAGWTLEIHLPGDAVIVKDPGS